MLHIDPRKLFRHKKNESLPFATTWLQLKIISVSEISQTQKAKEHIISSMWNVRNLIKEVEDRIIVTRDWLVQGGGRIEKLINGY